MTQEESKDEEWRYNGKDSMGEGELGEEKKKKTEQITKSPWIVKTSLLYYNLILVPKCIYFFLDILEFKYSLDSVTNHRLVTFCTGI